MSNPQFVQDTRRKSIARLIESPNSQLPMLSLLPKMLSPLPMRSRLGSFTNSPHANSPFLKDFQEDDVAIESELENEDAASQEDRTKFLEQVSQLLPIDNLNVEGADITRDIVKLSRQPSPIRRLHSFSLFLLRRGSTASLLNVPGGFRREFIVSKKRHPHFLAANFVEFLSIYGHFAGEDLEDDEVVACHFEPIKPKYDEQILLVDNDKNHNYINRRGTATDRKAYFLLLKAFVGTGVLFLPKAFSNGGLFFSALTLIFFGGLSYWCYLILVYTKIQTRVSSFAEIGYKLYGRWLQQLILTSIVVSQIGFVAAYIVFTSENLKAFVTNVSGYTFESYWFIILQVILLTPLSLIRDITTLSLLSLLANMFIFIGLITIIYFLLFEWLITNGGALGPDIEFWFNKTEFSVFIGVAIFAFEGIGLIFPIQESMIYPNHFPRVLFNVISTISLIFVGMGILGYLTYGSKIQTVILLNLPQDLPFVIMIQLLYSVAILLSTPLQLFPAIRLVELKLFSKTGKNSPLVKWLKNLFRFGFVLVTSVIALYGGHNLDKFISLIGCFACIPLVYMYPPILHLKSCCVLSDDLTALEYRKRWLLGNLNYCLVLIGGCAMVYTTLDILGLIN